MIILVIVPSHTETLREDITLDLVFISHSETVPRKAQV